MGWAKPFTQRINKSNIKVTQKICRRKWIPGQEIWQSKYGNDIFIVNIHPGLRVYTSFIYESTESISLIWLGIKQTMDFIPGNVIQLAVLIHISLVTISNATMLWKHGTNLQVYEHAGNKFAWTLFQHYEFHSKWNKWGMWNMLVRNFVCTSRALSILAWTYNVVIFVPDSWYGSGICLVVSSLAS